MCAAGGTLPTGGPVLYANGGTLKNGQTWSELAEIGEKSEFREIFFLHWVIGGQPRDLAVFWLGCKKVKK